MSKEPRCPYASFKNDRERLWALVSRDLRMVAISMLCAAATGGGDALRELVALWLKLLPEAAKERRSRREGGTHELRPARSSGLLTGRQAAVAEPGGSC